MKDLLYIACLSPSPYSFIQYNPNTGVDLHALPISAYLFITEDYDKGDLGEDNEVNNS